MDKIIISGIAVEGILGIHERERVDKQPIVVHLALEVDTRLAAASEEIDQAVNYSEVTNVVIEFVLQSRFLLIEALTAALAELVLIQFPLVEAVQVRVEKPQALAGRAENVAVEIRRERGER